MCNLQSLSDSGVPLLLKKAFYALRREHFKAIPDLACNPIRSQIIQAFFDRRCGPGGSTWLRLLLLCCSNVWELSPVFTETSVRTTTGRSRRSASRSSWWSCPTSGPRRCTWPRSSVRASGRRNCDVCVCRSEHMPAIILIHLRQSWQRRVCLSAVLFNMHDTDNDGMITLEEYRHVSLCSEEMLFTLISEVWSILSCFTVNKYTFVLTLEAFGTVAEMENKNGWK